MEKFLRKCPKCNFDIYYRSKYNRNSCEKRNLLCRSCSSKEIWNNFVFRNKTINTMKLNRKGINNSFYGKNHSKESKESGIKSRKENKEYQDYLKSDDFKEKMSDVTSGEKNGMYGKKVFDIWVEKYGIEEATKKEKERKKKISEKNKGNNNPMYGKSPKHSAGNGIGGWYKDIFFRSLRELSYIVNVLEKENKEWKSGENKDYRIEYFDKDNNHKTYVVDFIVENKKFVEIKPIRLQGTKLNIIKKETALKYCNLRNFTYEMVDIQIDIEQIKELYLNGLISFSNNVEEKFKKYFY